MLRIIRASPETYWGTLANGADDQIEVLLHLIRQTGAVDIDARGQMLIKTPHSMEPNGIIWELLQIKLGTGAVAALPASLQSTRYYAARRNHILRHASKAKVAVGTEGGIFLTLPDMRPHILAVSLMDLYESIRPDEAPRIIWNDNQPDLMIAGLPVPPLSDAEVAMETVDRLRAWLPPGRPPRHVRTDGQRGAIRAYASYPVLPPLLVRFLDRAGVRCDLVDGKVVQITLTAKAWHTVCGRKAFRDVMAANVYSKRRLVLLAQDEVDATLAACLPKALTENGETVVIDIGTLNAEVKQRLSSRLPDIMDDRLVWRPAFRLMTLIFQALRPDGAPVPHYNATCDLLTLTYQPPRTLSQAQIERLITRTQEWLSGMALHV